MMIITLGSFLSAQVTGAGLFCGPLKFWWKYFLFWCCTSETEPVLAFSMFTAAPLVCLRPHGNSWGQRDGLYGINIRRGVTQPISSCVCTDRLRLSLPLSWLSLRAFSRLCHLLLSGTVPLRCALQLPKVKPEQNVYLLTETCLERMEISFCLALSLEIKRRSETRWNSSFVTLYVAKQAGRSTHVDVGGVIYNKGEQRRDENGKSV